MVHEFDWEVGPQIPSIIQTCVWEVWESLGALESPGSCKGPASQEIPSAHQTRGDSRGREENGLSEDRAETRRKYITTTAVSLVALEKSFVSLLKVTDSFWPVPDQVNTGPGGFQPSHPGPCLSLRAVTPLKPSSHNHPFRSEKISLYFLFSIIQTLFSGIPFVDDCVNIWGMPSRSILRSQKKASFAEIRESLWRSCPATREAERREAAQKHGSVSIRVFGSQPPPMQMQ
jgi:hypothetical protein